MQGDGSGTGAAQAKSALITAVAYLQVCNCKQHAMIVTAGGCVSPAFCSKEGGREQIAIGVANGHISKEESMILQGMLDSTCMPAQTERASAAALIKVELINRLYSEHFWIKLDMGKQEQITSSGVKTCRTRVTASSEARPIRRVCRRK